MEKCQYCNKEFKNIFALNAHYQHCEHSPSYAGLTKEELIKRNKKGAETYKSRHPELFEKHIYTFICPKCQKEYQVELTEAEFKRGDYRKFCSRKCANSRAHTDETKQKIRESLKTSQTLINPKPLKIYYCKNCGKPFTVVDNDGGRKFCCKECRETWLKENIYSKSGGYRKGSGRGEHGWYKGIHCDSSWELAFLIYHLEHGNKIDRCHDFVMYEYQGEMHKYFPDFILNGTIYEIKGYKSKQWEAKEKAIPNLIVLYKDDMKEYIDYVIKKYGTDFVRLYDDSNPKQDLSKLKHVWVNKDNKNALIQVEKYDEYLNNGWVRGRYKK